MNEKMFMHPGKYGYCVNILHPDIRPRYEEFKKQKSIPAHFPPSDEERFEFENMIIREYLEIRKDHKKYLEPLIHSKDSGNDTV